MEPAKKTGRQQKQMDHPPRRGRNDKSPTSSYQKPSQAGNGSRLGAPSFFTGDPRAGQLPHQAGRQWLAATLAAGCGPAAITVSIGYRSAVPSTGICFSLIDVADGGAPHRRTQGTRFEPAVFRDGEIPTPTRPVERPTTSTLARFLHRGLDQGRCVRRW